MERYFEVEGLDYIEDMVKTRMLGNIEYEKWTKSDRPMTEANLKVVTHIADTLSEIDDHISTGVNIMWSFAKLADLLNDLED